MHHSHGIDLMFGLSRRQEIVARIVEMLKECYPQVAAAAIPASSIAGKTSEIPLVLLLREEVADPVLFSEEVRGRLEKITGAPFALFLLGAVGGPDDAGLLRSGQLILDRDPRFRADYTWSAGKGLPASLTTGGSRRFSASASAA